MFRHPRSHFAASVICAGLSGITTRAASSQILAQNYVLVAKSSDPKHAPLYSPAIIRLPSGRLAGSYTQARVRGSPLPEYQVFVVSDDGGVTWRTTGKSSALQGRFFTAGGALYYLATGPGLPIQRSGDGGLTWSAPALLTERAKVWNQTAANVWHAKGNIYLSMEHAGRKMNAWAAAEKGVVLLRGRDGADLTRAQSWTFSSEITFADQIPGDRENDPQLDYFGIPFYRQEYPNRARVSPSRSFSPMGWAEGNVVQIMNPNDYWYDPSGRTFLIFLRALTGMSNYGALVKVVENPDGSMTAGLERAPSGKKVLFLPFPGGQLRFHVLYDPPTRLYWLLSNQTTDSMRRADRLPADRNDLAFGERQRLVLHFSRNMIDWCFAGAVAIGGSALESRDYACMDFDGSDLVILCRSGDGEARSAHDTDLITFHRVRNFRTLAY
jgi:hypothetical protein